MPVVALARLVVVRTPEQVVEHRAELRRQHHREKARPRRAKQRAERLMRKCAWADPAAIAAVYAEAARLTRKTGIDHEVDHILPLRGRMVSGLHVETNLQVLPWYENRWKTNAVDEEVVGGEGFEPPTSSV